MPRISCRLIGQPVQPSQVLCYLLVMQVGLFVPSVTQSAVSNVMLCQCWIYGVGMSESPIGLVM